MTYSSRRYPRAEDGRAGRRRADRKSTNHFLIHTQKRREERERESKKQRKATNPKSPPLRDAPPPKKTEPIGDQVFKYLSLLGMPLTQTTTKGSLAVLFFISALPVLPADTMTAQKNLQRVE